MYNSTRVPVILYRKLLHNESTQVREDPDNNSENTFLKFGSLLIYAK